jgi:hypothetical protein
MSPAGVGRLTGVRRIPTIAEAEMKQIRVRSRPRVREPAPLDLRTPSGRVLPY